MNSKGLGSSGSSVGVITEIVDISRSQGNAKPLWPSIGADGLGDRMLAGHAPEKNMWNTTPAAECPLSHSKASGFLGTSAREDFDVGTSNSCLSQVTGGKQLHQRSGKVVRSHNGSSKRSRIVQIEVSVNEIGVEDVNEKPQLKRQKSTANGKQRDKRNGKLPKSRSDPFSLKNGIISFGSVVGGGNLLAYGYKSGNFDAASHVDELPLDELLDGSYACQSLVKDKEKSVENMDDNLLNSVKKAFSVLRLQSPVPIQMTGELELDNDQTTSICSTTDADAGAGAGAGAGSGSGSGAGAGAGAGSPEIRFNGGNETLCTANQPSIDKDCIARRKVVSTIDDSQLYKPIDVLNLLMLPPPKELETLLTDAVKPPASSSKNSNDLRLGKTISNRTGLPPFPWSLNSSGHSKSGPDALKLAANRPSCQGRWLKVNTITSPKVSATGFLVDFETLSFDDKLVPVIVNQQFRPIEKENNASLVLNQQVVSSTTKEVPLDEHSSGFLAAETLCQISTHSSKDALNEPKKSKKPLKTTTTRSKSKLDGKSASIGGSENLLKKPDGNNSPSSKKLKFLYNGHTESARSMSPMNWSAPRSIRSSSSSSSGSSKLKEDPRSSSSILKKSYMMMMPPPSNRIIDKGSGNSNKLKLKDKLQTDMN